MAAKQSRPVAETLLERSLDAVLAAHRRWRAAARLHGQESRQALAARAAYDDARMDVRVALVEVPDVR